MAYTYKKHILTISEPDDAVKIAYAKVIEASQAKVIDNNSSFLKSIISEWFDTNVEDGIEDDTLIDLVDELIDDKIAWYFSICFQYVEVNF